MRTQILVVILVLLVSCTQRDHVSPKPPSFPVEISGRISGTLKIESSPYHVVGDLLVDSLQTLIIEPGVRLNFNGDVELVVRGQLLAKGTVERPILFTASQSTWEGIRLLGGQTRSELQFAVIEKVLLPAGGVREYGAVEINGADVFVSNTIFRDNKADLGGGLACVHANARVTNCIFQRNHARTFGGGILLFESGPTIINCVFVENGTDNAGGGIGSIRSTGNIQNSIFYKNTARIGDPRVSIIFERDRQPETLYNFVDLFADPRFVSDNDFHLSINSPCINQGNPAPQYNDVDDSRNDQGAYGGPLGEW